MGAKIVLNRVILTFFAAFLSFLFYPRFSKSLPHKVGPRCSAMTQHRPLIGQDRNKNTFSLIKKQKKSNHQTLQNRHCKIPVQTNKKSNRICFLWLNIESCLLSINILLAWITPNRTFVLSASQITFDARHVIESRAYFDERIGNFCDSFWFYVVILHLECNKWTDIPTNEQLRVLWK